MSNAVLDEVGSRAGEAQPAVPVVEMGLRVENDGGGGLLDHVLHQRGGQAVATMLGAGDHPADPENVIAVIEHPQVRGDRTLVLDPHVFRQWFGVSAIDVVVDAFLLDDEDPASEFQDVVQLR